MPSLFAGTDWLICRALGIQKREQLNRRSLRLDPVSEASSLRLVNQLYEQMASNFTGNLHTHSEKLWRTRRATEIRDDNCDPETILEKAVANLADGGHMADWYNQCPVASGVTESSKDRRRAIDLINLSKRKARLIELKWASNTPAYALFQVLEYGLAYVFAVLQAREFHLEQRRLMRVDRVALEVVAPSAFYEHETQSDLFASVNTSVGRFAAEKTGGTVSMSLQALSFPLDFDRIPFNDGRAVKNGCRGDTPSDEALAVRNAFSQLAPIN